jgi:hypothetical protein
MTRTEFDDVSDAELGQFADDRIRDGLVAAVAFRLGTADDPGVLRPTLA